MSAVQHGDVIRPESFDVLGCRKDDEEKLKYHQGILNNKQTGRGTTSSSQLEYSALLIGDIHTYETRVSLLWAGEDTSKGVDDSPAVARLEEWVEAEVVPDVLVIGENLHQ